MATHTLRTEIALSVPPSHAWTVLTDFAAYPDWNPFIVSLEGELVVGTALHVVLRTGRWTFPMQPTVTTVAPGEGFAWRGQLIRPGVFDGTHRFMLVPQGDHACRLVHEESFEGWAVSPLLAVIGTATARGFDTMNQAFKARCEGLPETGPSTA